VYPSLRVLDIVIDFFVKVPSLLSRDIPEFDFVEGLLSNHGLRAPIIARE
jgi:hypothetical protein